MDHAPAVAPSWIRHGWPLRALLALVIAFPLLAADEDSPWSVRVWKAVDGLGANNVRSILQTPDGFLWFVAGGKLSRFDGIRLEEFPVVAVAGNLDPQVRLPLSLRDGGFAFLLFDGAVVIRSPPPPSSIIVSARLAQSPV